jgi:competence ComEA-like helix-hairpin-helix protein
MNDRGSVLVGLLWCLALLSVLVVGILHASHLELVLVKNHGDQIQAHYLALAGIEKAKALLYHDAAARKRSARNHSGDLYDSPESFRDSALGRGHFRVFHQSGRDEGAKLAYGVTDEESRLNLNQASQDELTKLYGLTPEIAVAILDWRDSDNAPGNGGAEVDYYAGLQPPYLPRNGPFQTVRELLMVRGITSDLLLGEDANQNGLLDPEEDDGRDSEPVDNHDGVLDAGWSGLLTVSSGVANVNAAGDPRINVQNADEKELTKVRGITPELAKAIIAYRQNKELKNLADLLDVAAVQPTPNSAQLPPSTPPANAGNARPAGNRAQPATAPQTTGPKLISQELLMDIADDITTGGEDDQVGAININTASVEVLACLPGLTRELAQAIVAYRKSAGFFPNAAWLLKVDGLTREMFQQVSPLVCARSETFRILSEGRVDSTGTRKRIEAVVRLGSTGFETLGYREDL